MGWSGIGMSAPSALLIKPNADDPEKASDEAIAKLLIAFKEALGDDVRDVRSTERLTDSAVCLVAGEGDMDLHLARMLKRQGHMDIPIAPRILELNPSHPLIKSLSAQVDDVTKREALNDMAYLLLDQAHIIEGEAVADPVLFSQRLNALLEKGI